ncbi:MAG TPA: AraC family transcriptional regulator [Vicinamibacterales bacterium]|nr:AraC family transcriptional regulator [Vicinamibacterales bacterium]
MAEIAVDVERALARRRTHGEPGRLDARPIAKGHGWTVEDIVCSCGPEDHPYDEQHDTVALAIVIAGTFQYRGSGSNGREMMTPGSVLLGSPGQSFECGHEHGVGDRCLSFHFTPEYFEAITARAERAFRSLRLPPVRTLSPVIADACAALAEPTDVQWEELGIRLASRAVQVDAGIDLDRRAISPAAVARVTRTVRLIEAQPARELTTLVYLAREAGLNPFHYLRTFERVTGTTPHQYLVRARLRAAATRLALEQVHILDVALDAGFGDISNFNRAFRAEFGVSPRRFRQRRRQ